MRIADAVTGEVRTLFEETSKTQIGGASLTENLWRVLPKSNELIWWSQRDNWLQLYLYDLTTGQLKNKITTDTGNVDEIIRVDEKTRSVYYLDPIRKRVATRFSSIVSAQWTREEADHEGDANHVVSMFTVATTSGTYSTPSPPVTVLRKRGACRERSRSRRFAWRPRDGTDNQFK